MSDLVDMNAEQALIASLLQFPDQWDDVRVAVGATDFGLASCRVCWQAFEALDLAKTPFNTVTLASALMDAGTLDVAGGRPAVMMLDAGDLFGADAAVYARRIRDMATRRRLVDAARQAAEAARNLDLPLSDALDRAETRILSVRDAVVTTPGATHIGALVAREHAALNARYESQTPVTGVRTGFKELDSMTTGLHPGQLAILAARPGIGKTTLAMNMATHAAVEHHSPVLVFSLEMSDGSLTQRMMASEGRLDGDQIRTGQLMDDAWAKLARATERLRKAPIYVNDTCGTSVAQMRSIARRMRKQHGIQLVVVDYLQLAAPPERQKSREQEVAAISRGLKLLARDVGVAVIALAQLSRSLESRSDKRPMLSDLRESGGIEQDADLVMFIHREGVFDKTAAADQAELIVAKQREGRTGTINVRYRSSISRFEDAA